MVNSRRKVFLIRNASFFLQRKKDMTCKSEIANSVVASLTSKHKSSIFVVKLTDSESWMSEYLNGDNVHVFLYDPNNVGENTKELRNVLRKAGVAFGPIRNIRAVSILNIDKFVVSDNFISVGGDDYYKLGIVPEKDPSFEDMEKVRKVNAWI